MNGGLCALCSEDFESLYSISSTVPVVLRQSPFCQFSPVLYFGALESSYGMESTEPVVRTVPAAYSLPGTLKLLASRERVGNPLGDELGDKLCLALGINVE